MIITVNGNDNFNFEHAIVRLIDKEFDAWLWPYNYPKKRAYKEFAEYINTKYNVVIEFSDEYEILSINIPDHIHTFLELQYS